MSDDWQVNESMDKSSRARANLKEFEEIIGEKDIIVSKPPNINDESIMDLDETPTTKENSRSKNSEKLSSFKKLSQFPESFSTNNRKTSGKVFPSIEGSPIGK